MTLHYLNNSDEPEQFRCQNDKTLRMNINQMARLVVKEGILITLDGKTVWIPPTRILKIVLD